MKKMMSALFLVFLFASCQKTYVSDAGDKSAQKANTSSLSTLNGGVPYTSIPAPYTFTKCTTKPLNTNCGTLNQGMKAYCGGFYGDLMMIHVERCDGLAFDKKGASQVEVHYGTPCGNIVGRTTIGANGTWGNIYFNIGYVDTAKYISIVVLPDGTKMYANSILAVHQQ